MAGAVLVFFGLFGRFFILGPGFIVGMLLADLGLFGVIFGYIGFESCGSGLFPGPSLCPAYHPELFEPFILIGVLLVATNAFWWNSGSGKSYAMSKPVLAMFLGVVSVAVGTILVAFGWAVVGTFVGNYVEIHSLYWMQLVIGLLLVPAGIVLVGWSVRTMRAETKAGLERKSFQCLKSQSSRST